MKSVRYFSVIGILSVLIGLVAFPSVARPPDCDDICTWSSDCNLSCYGGGPTCGDYGVCSTPPCQPQWVETGRVSTGGFQNCQAHPQLPQFIICKHYTVYDVYYHDLNGCYPDYIACKTVYDEVRWGFTVEEFNTCRYWSNSGGWGIGVCGGKQGCP